MRRLPLSGPSGEEVQEVDILRIDEVTAEEQQDLAAREEPLEIRLGGAPFVVIMRTPRQDRELAAGFLLSERIIRGAHEIASMRHCADSDVPANVLNVWPAGEAVARAATALAGRRAVTATSSCGVCGRRSISDLMHDLVPVGSTWTLPPRVVASLPATLRAAQATFDLTGGLHGAGLFDRDGRLIASAEDVGRHNAVDKVIGHQLLAGRLPLAASVLFVSGRTSFEIVQKAVVAGIPVVAAVSAPTSLAIECARSANVTLLGFVRDRACNVYSSPHRVRA